MRHGSLRLRLTIGLSRRVIACCSPHGDSPITRVIFSPSNFCLRAGRWRLREAWESEASPRDRLESRVTTRAALLTGTARSRVSSPLAWGRDSRTGGRARPFLRTLSHSLLSICWIGGRAGGDGLFETAYLRFPVNVCICGSDERCDITGLACASSKSSALPEDGLTSSRGFP